MYLGDMVRPKKRTKTRSGRRRSGQKLTRKMRLRQRVARWESDGFDAALFGATKDACRELDRELRRLLAE